MPVQKVEALFDFKPTADVELELKVSACLLLNTLYLLIMELSSRVMKQKQLAGLWVYPNRA